MNWQPRSFLPPWAFLVQILFYCLPLDFSYEAEPLVGNTCITIYSHCFCCVLSCHQATLKRLSTKPKAFRVPFSHGYQDKCCILMELLWCVWGAWSDKFPPITPLPSVIKCCVETKINPVFMVRSALNKKSSYQYLSYLWMQVYRPNEVLKEEI